MKVLTLIRRHKIAAVAVGVVAVLCALVAVFVVQLATAPGMESCATQTLRRVRGPGPYDAYVVEKGCYGIVGSDTIYVELANRAKGGRRIAFSYEVAGASGTLPARELDPKISWHGPSRLRVSVDVVSSISKKRNDVAGVAIEYHIGSVEFK